MFQQAARVYPLNNYELLVFFENGKARKYGVSPLFEKYPVFKQLKSEPGLFESAHLSPGGYGIIWNSELDLSTAEVYYNGEAVDMIPLLLTQLTHEIKQARKSCGISQKELGKLSNTSQPIIARTETGASSPRVDTLIKMLAPLGKTLAVAPLRVDNDSYLDPHNGAAEAHRYTYHAYWDESEGHAYCSVAEFPEIISGGDTLEEAIHHTLDEVAYEIDRLKRSGTPLPEPLPKPADKHTQKGW